MAKRFDIPLTILCVLAVLIIIIAAVGASYKSMESFAEENAPLLVNSIKACLYNTNGLYNFYSSGDTGSFIYMNRESFEKVVSYAIGFQHTSVDGYCKIVSNSNTDVARCKNLYIDSIAYPDKYFQSVSSLEVPCTSVLSAVGSKPENSLVRIFNNTYSLQKRCIKFNSIRITVENPQAKTFRVVVSGNIQAFVLSRPIYISFGTYGLYQIVHNYQGSIFSKYDSSAQIETFFIVKQIVTYGDAAMFPTTTQDIGMFDNINVPITIYYLNFVKPIPLDKVSKGSLPSTNINNALTVVLSDDFLKANSLSTNSISYVLPTSFNSQSTFVNAATVTINYNNTSTNANEILRVVVRSGRDAQDISVKVPPTFLNALVQARQSNLEHKFHIVLTYTMDVFICVCFLKHREYNLQEVFMSRQTIKHMNNYVHVVYDATTMLEAMQRSTGNLAKEMEKYQEFAPISAIPNYAYVARFLGYDV